MPSDFQPVTDSLDQIDDDDTPISSSAQIRDRRIQKNRLRIVLLVVIVLGVGLIISGQSVFRVLVAVSTMYVLLRIGFATIGALARPVPEPPPPGELRKVKLTYRCSSCGTELRMTLANDQDPTPPRHCADEMELQTATDLH